jgi:GntR family transcriptional regulator, transcriptional repressor for pyruvate dehydrogenase complex
MNPAVQQLWERAMEPIRKIAVHEQVVDRLRRAIHLGDYLPGDRLPSERDIAERLQVSRESVREALRVLESDGYVVSRRGPAGGHTVTALSEPAARTLERLRAERDGLVHLMEFRSTNECLAARLAAERRTRADVTTLRRSVDALREAADTAQFRRADASFHLAIAVAARNTYVERAIMDAREAIFLLHDGLDYEVVLDTTLDGHTAILCAIEDKDADGAQRAMARHMETALGEIREVLSANKRRTRRIA